MTEQADAMARVVGEIAPILKRAGFKKRRHSFNRQVDVGLVHVIHFQMGSFLPPGADELPPWRYNMYGSFTVNVGVFLGEVHRNRMRREPPTWINEYNCDIRQRLGYLMPDQADIWWTLSDYSSALAAVRDAIVDYALPWLEEMRSRDAILSLHDTKGRRYLGLPPAAPAIMNLIRASALPSSSVSQSTTQS